MVKNFSGNNVLYRLIFPLNFFIHIVLILIFPWEVLHSVSLIQLPGKIFKFLRKKIIEIPAKFLFSWDSFINLRHDRFFFFLIVLYIKRHILLRGTILCPIYGTVKNKEFSFYDCYFFTYSSMMPTEIYLHINELYEWLSPTASKKWNSLKGVEQKNMLESWIWFEKMIKIWHGR